MTILLRKCGHSPAQSFCWDHRLLKPQKNNCCPRVPTTSSKSTTNLSIGKLSWKFEVETSDGKGSCCKHSVGETTLSGVNSCKIIGFNLWSWIVFMELGGYKLRLLLNAESSCDSSISAPSSWSAQQERNGAVGSFSTRFHTMTQGTRGFYSALKSPPLSQAHPDFRQLACLSVSWVKTWTKKRRLHGFLEFGGVACV